jgi:hypothetical protein
MTKVLISFLAILVFVSCSKKELPDVNMSDVVETNYLSSKPIVYAVGSNSFEVTYYNQAYDYTYVVNFDIFKNYNHPKGYILIKTIKFTESNKTITLSIPDANNPTDYISNIHKLDTFKVLYNGYERSLANHEVRWIFRTSEAMIMAAKQQNATVKQAEVFYACQQMLNRLFGNSIEPTF